MPAIPVKIRHAGKQYDAELDADKPASEFQESVHRLTDVPVANQKIIIKGGMLKADTNLASLNIKPGHIFLIVGAKSSLPPPPAPSANDDNLNMAVDEPAPVMPVGLTNIGNTCYMNSVVEMFRGMPELRPKLSQFNGSMLSQQNNEAVVSSLRDLYKNLDSAKDPLAPAIFWQVLKKSYPQFAELREGHPAQQDAEECLNHLISNFVSHGSDFNDLSNFVNNYMTGETSIKMECVENPDEEPVKTVETMRQLKCNVTNKTNFLLPGIKDGLDEEIIQKESPTLGKNTDYRQIKRLSKIPTYLTVHLVRFFWRRDIGKKTKILRQIKFPTELDVLELLDDDLKQKVTPVNQRLREIMKDRRDRANNRSKVKQTNKEELERLDKENSEKRKQEKEELEKLAGDYSLGSNPSAMYELVSLVTHKGSDADGGHYINWTRSDMVLGSNDNDFKAKKEWFKFDDDKVTTVDEEKVLSLTGGEDSSAYIFMYRAVEF